jgi:hypothetical protein
MEVEDRLSSVLPAMKFDTNDACRVDSVANSDLNQISMTSLPPAPPDTKMNRTSRQEQFVNLTDIFSLLRTAESEGRLSADKGSRLRHVLMEAESSARANGVCWMNIVFRVLCELIPAPVYPSTAGGAGEIVGGTSLDATSPHHEDNIYPRWSEESSYQDVKSEAQDDRDKFSNAVPAQSLQETLCKPCLQLDTRPTSINNESEIENENDDAIAALLEMKMNPSPTNNNKRKSSTQDKSEPPIKATAASAIYPHPFSSLKDPKLYRRTRCKVPNCPNIGRACPEHGHDIKICKSEGCTNRAVKSGVCSKHGAKRPLCRVEGCSNQAKREGRCIKHGAVYGNCSEEGCCNQARSGGLCRKHGAK